MSSTIDYLDEWVLLDDCRDADALTICYEELPAENSSKLQELSVHEPGADSLAHLEALAKYRKAWSAMMRTHIPALKKGLIFQNLPSKRVDWGYLVHRRVLATELNNKSEILKHIKRSKRGL
jgi:hypothetical protein